MAARRSVTAAVLVGAIGVAAATAAARDPAVNFAGSDSTFAGDCHGQDANLSGSDNSVTIRGACRAFQIAGDGNRVAVDMAAGGAIKVYGKNNRVSWTANGEVEINAVGPGNTVTRTR